MKWSSFLQALAASAIAASANAAGQAIQSATAPGGKTNWKVVGNSAIFGAVLGALSFMAQPPAVQPVQPAKEG